MGVPVALGVVRLLGRVAVRVQVDGAVVVPVQVHVHAALDDAAQHAPAERDQHHADPRLQQAGGLLRHRQPEQQADAADGEQHDAVAGPPGGPLQHGAAEAPLARRQRRHRRQMVGLQRVAQAEQDAEEQERGQFTQRSTSRLMTLFG